MSHRIDDAGVAIDALDRVLELLARIDARLARIVEAVALKHVDVAETDPGPRRPEEPPNVVPHGDEVRKPHRFAWHCDLCGADGVVGTVRSDPLTDHGYGRCRPDRRTDHAARDYVVRTGFGGHPRQYQRDLAWAYQAGRKAGRDGGAR